MPVPNIPSSDDGRIEKLKKGLYSREAAPKIAEDTLPHFSHKNVSVASDWEHKEQPFKPFMVASNNNSWLKRLFIASLIFFVISIGVAAFMIFGGGNVISSRNVEIAITGPVSIDAGKDLFLQVEIQNQNNTTLESVDLVIDYPEGARNAADLGQELKRYRESIGDILPGRTATKRIQAVLFGEEGAIKKIVIGVEYRVAGSNAVLNKEKVYEVAVSSAPVSVTIDSLKEANAGQEIEFVVNVVSNSNSPIQNVLLVSGYPFGFEFLEATPRPTQNTTLWDLGTFSAGEKKTIKVRGKIEGQDGEERAFRFTVGTAAPNKPKEIAIPFLTQVHALTIQKPFLGLELSVNGDSSKTHVTEAGSTVRADIFWTNNTASRITNPEISVKLKGTVFDKSSILTEGGFYRSVDDTITWNQTNTRGFDVLNPGDSGRVSFSFRVLDLAQNGAVLRNPQMVIEISAKGKRLESSNVPEEISSSVVRTIQLSTKLGIISRAVYNAGPFQNSGPLPPRAEQETTYTVIWSLSNPSNDVRNASVSAILPSYIQWLGEVSPGADVRYNQATGEVVWNAGEVRSGTGFGTPSREVAFKISFTPSVTQVGSSPNLMGQATVTAEDIFTKTTVRSTSPQALTTMISTDPLFGVGQGTVAP